jgi:hypothetical protein
MLRCTNANEHRRVQLQPGAIATLPATHHLPLWDGNQFNGCIRIMIRGSVSGRAHITVIRRKGVVRTRGVGEFCLPNRRSVVCSYRMRMCVLSTHGTGANRPVWRLQAAILRDMTVDKDETVSVACLLGRFIMIHTA